MPWSAANFSILAYLPRFSGVLFWMSWSMAKTGWWGSAMWDVGCWRRNRPLGHLIELWDDRAGVVVGHHVLGADGDEVAALDELAGGEGDGVALGDFLDQGLGHGEIVRRGSEPWVRAGSHGGASR